MEKHKKALRLKEILKDEYFCSAIADLKVDMLIQVTLVNDDEAVLDIHKKLLAVDGIIGYLESMVYNITGEY